MYFFFLFFFFVCVCVKILANIVGPHSSFPSQVAGPTHNSQQQHISNTYTHSHMTHNLSYVCICRRSSRFLLRSVFAFDQFSFSQILHSSILLLISQCFFCDKLQKYSAHSIRENARYHSYQK